MRRTVLLCRYDRIGRGDDLDLILEDEGEITPPADDAPPTRA
jgi:hypothetical protein